ncbi:hypothetical protein FA13DRAFT_1308432 [Coprinellus micaceus]|uniref:Uncharacterized protein n=1 Tax=Coprinellus micaceus TaxID=71717 RepID=A0A4Y7R5L9_COPMI|nr:hypothetical protein FA13DRAFT_1308432 [Coprinellus micaceus]
MTIAIGGVWARCPLGYSWPGLLAPAESTEASRGASMDAGEPGAACAATDGRDQRRCCRREGKRFKSVPSRKNLLSASNSDLGSYDSEQAIAAYRSRHSQLVPTGSNGRVSGAQERRNDGPTTSITKLGVRQLLAYPNTQRRRTGIECAFFPDISLMAVFSASTS